MNDNPNLAKYIDYLVNDLEEVIKSKPVETYWEKPPQFENLEDLAELALSPFKTIEEWTGIQEEAFPCIIDINMDMCKRINKAILNIYNWLKLEIIDLPKNIPADVLYETLRFHWDLKVQYLPSSGMDVELCANDIEDCLYGKYCEYCHSSDPEK